MMRPLSLSAAESFYEAGGAIIKFMTDHAIAISAVVVSAALIFILIKVYSAVRKSQIKRLKYSRDFSLSGVFEGEHVIFRETITNTSNLPMLFVDIEAYIYGELALDGYTGLHEDDMQYFISRFHLMPRATVTRSRRMTVKKRGVYELSTVCVYKGKTPFYIEAPAKLYVYPKYKNVDEYSTPMNTLIGDVVTKRRLITDPFNVSGIRDLAPGDPFNLINFKATAKTGGRVIKVNEREFCSGRIFMIYMNFQPPTDNTIPTPRYNAIMEDTLSFAASIVRKALSDGYRVGFAANCKNVTGEQITRFLPAAGPGVLEEMLRVMAGMRFDCAMSFSAMLAEYAPFIRDSEVYIMTPYISQEHDAQIKAYKRRNNNIVIFNTGR